MRRFAWGIALVLLVVAPAPVGAVSSPDAPKDWVRALRNNDETAFAHVPEAGPDEVAFLREALRHKEADCRIAAAQRLADLKARWAADALQAHVDDRNPGVAVAARLALQALGLGGGTRAFHGMVYPGADLDKREAKGGAIEFVLLSKDGARNVSGYYERALADLGWDRLREIGETELPERCRAPWGGIYGRGPISFLVLVCGGAAPGNQVVIRLKVREATAEKVLGSSLEGTLKSPGIH